MQYDLVSIIKNIKNKYKNFDCPDYSFVDPLLPKQCAIFKELSENYSTLEDTDFNCEVCLHYYTKDHVCSWEVCVSLIGPYAMVSKEISPNRWQVISRFDEISSSDLDLIMLLERHGYYAMPEASLKTIIPDFVLNDENGSPQRGAFLYQILFFHSYLQLLCDKCERNVIESEKDRE